MQPLNKDYINNLVAVAPSNLDVALGDSEIWQMALRKPLGPRAAAHKAASPSVFKCSLSRKAKPRSEAEMIAVMAAHVSCGRVSRSSWRSWSLKG
jgi:hypothetical protein